MHRIDNSTAATSLPTPIQPGTPGYFTGGSPTTGTPATIVEADWMNAVQEELAYVIEASGLTLAKTDRTQLYQAFGKLTRIRLTGPFTLYVSPTGNDNNSGLSAATPLASITHAYNIIRDRIDMNGFACTIKLADGTYSQGVCNYPAVGAWVTIVGNDNDPSTVIVNNANGFAIGIFNTASVALQSFTVTCGGTSADYAPAGDGVYVQNASSLINKMRFGACSTSHMRAELGGFIGFGIAGIPYSVVGGSMAHMRSSAGSTIQNVQTVVTLTGTPAFSQAFAYADNASFIYSRNSTWTGAATGSRYIVGAGSVIQTGGSGANYFPGSTAGSVNSGGIYA